MIGYNIPALVADDYQQFQRQYKSFIDGELDALAFKTYRVPFGIYEQREANTYMVRIKLAGGLITPVQLARLASLAERYGDKRIHVTTRGGAQLHYVQVDSFLPVVEALHQVGLTGRGGGGNTVRNITADPLAGIADDEVFDVTPHAIALTEAMLAQRDSYALPRKFKIAFSGSAADRGGATYIDVGYIARIVDGQRGFRVYVGGGMGAKNRLPDLYTDFLLEKDVFLLTQAIKEVFNEHGNRHNKHAARLRFLLEEMGISAFRMRVEKKMETLRETNTTPFVLSAIPEVPPLSGGSVLQLNDEQQTWWQRFVRPQKQQGYYTVKLPLMLGDLNYAHARELARQLQELATPADVIRFAADQNIWLRNLSAEQLLSLYPLLKSLSPLQSKAPIVGNIVVCTGAATCQLGVTIPRGALPAIEQALSAANLDLDLLNDLRIHLSGCPNSCGKHSIADLGFFGKLLRKNGIAYPAYNVLVGARIGEGITRFARKVTDISAYRLPAFVVEVLRTWLSIKDQYQTFADWLDAGGDAEIAAIAKQHADVPDFESNSAPYFDYSASKQFSLKDRGSGECSASLFDLTEADKKALSKVLKEELTVENMTTIRFLSARMLLVVKGEEARHEEKVLPAFKKLFIDSGLIDKEFIPLIEGPVTTGVVELAHAVLALYETLDHTLKFAAERVVAS